MDITITVSYKGTPHTLTLSAESTLDELQSELEALTSVSPSMQKLLYKGKKGTIPGSSTLSEAKITDGLKIQMLGTTSQELGDMQAAESEQQKRERILRERALKSRPTKVRNTGSASSSQLKYRFHQITPLAHLPNPTSAAQVLHRLADDEAVKHVMQLHQFSVGVLTELAPHEHPELLGLNENAGQSIKLRLRTNEYDGFRPYREIRRVLCHELTHNVWGDHDNNFKELNSKLNREVAEYERAKAEGTHSLSGHDFYEPENEVEREATVHVLGGSGVVPSSTSGSESIEERRRRVLEATTSRLKREEEILEDSCGTAGRASS